MAASKLEEGVDPKKERINKLEVEALTNMLFLRKNTQMFSPYQRFEKKSTASREFCEAHLVGTIDEGPPSATVSWRIMGMRMKRSEGVTTDYDVHRMYSDCMIEGDRIRERLPMERREGILRLCRYDSESDFKIFKHEYYIMKMLAKTYTTRAHRVHFPAIIGEGSLAELRYLNVSDSDGKHHDMVETPKVPRPYFIMEYIEPSIETLFKSNKNTFLPIHTSVYVTIGCIKALRLLHLKGFAHRNVQPAYFSLRLPCGGLLSRKESELSDLIAITDFSTCRRFRANFSKRNPLIYIGNWKYGSADTMSGKDPTAIDDIISCLYMLAEFVLGCIPWAKETSKQGIIDYKRQVEQWERVLDETHSTLLVKYGKLYEWLRDQPPLQTIDYEAFYELLLKTPGGISGDQSLFGFSNPLLDVYEHGFAAKGREGKRRGKVESSSTLLSKDTSKEKLKASSVTTQRATESRSREKTPAQEKGDSKEKESSSDEKALDKKPRSEQKSESKTKEAAGTPRAKAGKKNKKKKKKTESSQASSVANS
ncbi:unnamed protein product [Cylicocyclus nassatus]|uniref:Protein kinase domain-containing protein n=1 Tax=Cylicocyclus nassatus TaxID=53992 RepID=A0AA36GSS8_CYLNA|nr:unnamed protein product [Cylicocyclus nassatus]